MIIKKKVLFVTGIVFAATVVFALNLFHVFGNTDASWTDNSIKILFVGNSHVFTGNIPRQLKTLARAGGINLSYRDISTHGASLNNTREKAIAEMQNTDFDYIVIQDQGRRPLNDPDGFAEDVKILCGVAMENGAEPILYNPGFMNIDGLPDKVSQKPVSEAYLSASKDNDVILVNAGDAWIYAYETLSGISFYRQFDIRGPHASDEGAFYTACLFASALFDLKVESIPDENIYTGGNAMSLASKAWDFTQSVTLKGSRSFHKIAMISQKRYNGLG